MLNKIKEIIAEFKAGVKEGREEARKERELAKLKRDVRKTQAILAAAWEHRAIK